MAPHVRCKGITKKGDQCLNSRQEGTKYCWVHADRQGLDASNGEEYGMETSEEEPSMNGIVQTSAVPSIEVPLIGFHTTTTPRNVRRRSETPAATTATTAATATMRGPSTITPSNLPGQASIPVTDGAATVPVSCVCTLDDGSQCGNPTMARNELCHKHQREAITVMAAEYTSSNNSNSTRNNVSQQQPQPLRQPQKQPQQQQSQRHQTRQSTTPVATSARVSGGRASVSASPAPGGGGWRASSSSAAAPNRRSVHFTGDVEQVQVDERQQQQRRAGRSAADLSVFSMGDLLMELLRRHIPKQDENGDGSAKGESGAEGDSEEYEAEDEGYQTP